MTQNDTIRHRFSRVTALSFEQENAINLLLVGATDQSIAARLKIGRSTLYRWQRFHPGFIAELNRRRAALRATGMDGARSLIPRALETVRDQIVNGNGSLALAILDKAGVFGTRSTGPLLYSDIGPTEVEDVVDDEVRRRRADGRLPMPAVPQPPSDPNTASSTNGSTSSTDTKPTPEPPITDQEREAVLADLLAEATSDAPLAATPATPGPAPANTPNGATTGNGTNGAAVGSTGSMSSLR